MMWSVCGNALFAFIMAITLIFNMGDIDSLLESPTRQPFIQLFYNATQSYAATNVMTSIVVVMLSACCISEVATASRQLWSFARDTALPGSAWLSVVCKHLNHGRTEVNLLGATKLESTRSIGPNLACHNISPRVHQYRLFDCAECHQLSGWGFGAYIVLHYYRLFYLETTLW